MFSGQYKRRNSESQSHSRVRMQPTALNLAKRETSLGKTSVGESCNIKESGDPKQLKL